MCLLDRPYLLPGVAVAMAVAVAVVVVVAVAVAMASGGEGENSRRDVDEGALMGGGLGVVDCGAIWPSTGEESAWPCVEASRRKRSEKAFLT